jgi:hypothetical protein
LHPAVAFGTVLFGAALFGAAGALVAVPISALLLSLVDIYSRQYELLPQLGTDPRVDRGEVGPGRSTRRGLAAQEATTQGRTARNASRLTCGPGYAVRCRCYMARCLTGSTCMGFLDRLQTLGLT